MKCRKRECSQEAMAGDPRCGFHKEEIEERIAAAAKDLKKHATPTPPRKQ